MDDDLFSRQFDELPKRDNLFGWTVFLLLLIGFAFATWIGSYYLFGHPENARSYKMLRKLKKIDPPKRFELTAAPPGKFFTAKQLYDDHWMLPPYQLAKKNETLLRDYLRNFTETKNLVPYVVGRFTILQSYELAPADLFPSGVVAVAQSVDFPQVLIEHVYTAPKEAVPQLKQMLATGLDIKLERANDLSAVIHVEKLSDGKLLFTVVPLLYGSYALKQGSGSFSLEPPDDLHLDTGVPIVKPARLENAFKVFAEYRREKGLPEKITIPIASASASPTPPPNAPLLVRIDPNPTPAPTPYPTPRITSSATPKISPTAKGALAKNAATPAEKPTPFSTGKTQPPPATPPPIAMANAAPTPARANPAGVKLEPFLAAAATPPVSTGNWRTYHPGQMPRGRLLEPNEAAQLADAGIAGERIYLSGKFVVTASGASRGENRAVLRPSSGGKAIGSTRIIVEFPAGFTPPPDGSNFSRDEQRPFLITDVRRGADGQVNIYAREITAPE